MVVIHLKVPKNGSESSATAHMRRANPRKTRYMKPLRTQDLKTSVNTVNTNIAVLTSNAIVRVFLWRKKTVTQTTRGPISTTRWRTAQGVSSYLGGNPESNRPISTPMTLQEQRFSLGSRFHNKNLI